ncbi:PilZ domain-containing protein [Vulgatibacter sp.]|uniref:PilZ domain-containing protein n=1 Tax=Vulgatibacter sp. TaxID=1971226 RepID=UPI00356173ED
MANQRKSQRAPCDIYLNKIVDEARHLARARDISPDGIWISKVLEPAAGQQQVGLEFQLPGSSEVIWAAGEVVRDETREAATGPVEGTAVKFTAMADRYRRMIEVYVSRTAGNA